MEMNLTKDDSLIGERIMVRCISGSSYSGYLVAVSETAIAMEETMCTETDDITWELPGDRWFVERSAIESWGCRNDTE